MVTSTSTDSGLSSPLYITVGPPCSGKTTWLREQQILDIAIDDQPDVYHPLPWMYFALNHVTDKEQLLHQTIIGKTVRERLYSPEQAELRTVCACLSGKMNAHRLQFELEQQFAREQQRRQQRRNNQDNKVPLAAVIASAVADVLRHSRTSFPATVDLFCVDALFTRNGEKDITAIERAYQTLEAAPTTQPVAWGNTNLRIDSDYSRALEMAYVQERPVHFVVFDATTQICLVNPTRIEYHPDDWQFCLEELMTRNIKRLLEKGRYIPVAVMHDMLHRYFDMIRRPSDNLILTLLRPSRFVRDPRTGLLQVKNQE
jgi:hypothetical protein